MSQALGVLFWVRTVVCVAFYAIRLIYGTPGLEPCALLVASVTVAAQKAGKGM